LAPGFEQNVKKNPSTHLDQLCVDGLNSQMAVYFLSAPFCPV
jgi:hypothetical protein